MKWFRKSSCESVASQENEKVKQRHKRIKKTIKIPTIKCMQVEEYCEAYMMTTSLCEVQMEPLQVLEPEDFFDDPVHVRNYREEAAFLALMSEWEFIENPSMSENYFSADFENEFVQIRTHNSSISTAICHSESSSTTSLTSMTFVSVCSSYSASPKLELKQILTEFLFADKIELGIFVPNKRLRNGGQRKRHTYFFQIAVFLS